MERGVLLGVMSAVDAFWNSMSLERIACAALGPCRSSELVGVRDGFTFVLRVHS